MELDPQIDTHQLERIIRDLEKEIESIECYHYPAEEVNKAQRELDKYVQLYNEYNKSEKQDIK